MQCARGSINPYDEVYLDSNNIEPKHASNSAETAIVLLYGEKGDGPQTEVKIFQETMWMTQRQMAELFNVDRTVIGKHLNNVFESGKPTQDMVCAKFAHTASDG